MDNLSEITIFNLLVKSVAQVAPFDGDKRNLADFINRMESFIPIIETLTEHQFKKLLLGHIQDRIVGPAKNTLLINGTPETWAQLKTILIRNHGESKPISKLIEELTLVRCTTTIKSFYNRINVLLCRINSAYLLTDNVDPGQIEINKRLALSIFKENLPEPVRGIIINRNPTTLFDAYNIIASNGYSNFSGIDNQNNVQTSQYNRFGNSRRNFRTNFNHNHSNNRQNFSNNSVNSNHPNYYNNRDSFNSQQQNFNRSNQTRSNRSRNNNNNYNSNYNRSGITQNRNQNFEPMEVSLNINNNETMNQNFQTNAPDNYPI